VERFICGLISALIVRVIVIALVHLMRHPRQKKRKYAAGTLEFEEAKNPRRFNKELYYAGLGITGVLLRTIFLF